MYTLHPGSCCRAIVSASCLVSAGISTSILDTICAMSGAFADLWLLGMLFGFKTTLVMIMTHCQESFLFIYGTRSDNLSSVTFQLLA